MPEATLPPKLRHATDDFIGEQLPDWLKYAGRQPLEDLRTCMRAHLQSQKRMAAVAQRLQPLEVFAARRLEAAIKQQLKLDIDLSRASWREERRHLSVVQGDVRAFESYFVTVPALQKLLQNFRKREAYFAATALVEEAKAPGKPERIVTQRIDELVELCRRSDVGQAYQEHLEQVLDAGTLRLLAEDKRLALAVAVEVAALKGQLAGSDLRMLRQVGKGECPELPGGLRLRMGGLQVLGCRVDGALVFELIGTLSGISGVVFNPARLQAVLLYLPDDHQRPIRRFADMPSLNRALAVAMADAELRKALGQRIALEDQARYQVLLGKRLQDEAPDLEPARAAGDGELFSREAAAQSRRVKADAAFLAVPTRQADAGAAAERLRALQSAGLVLLNLVGLFVPVVGTLLLADLARQVLGQVFEGVADWSQGHRHEALEHMLQVASTLVAGGATVVGTRMLGSAFVKQLQPVITELGHQRLWRYDLRPYQAPASLARASELDNGLFKAGDAHYWQRDDVFYRVRRDGAGTWRLLHRDGPGVFGPVLESNGERAWRLAYERPLEWQGAALLLKRLWPAAAALDATRVEQVLTVAQVDEAYLRGLLVESRRLPVRLRDTLERFAVDARIEAFFARPGEDAEARQWCVDTLALQGETPARQDQAILAQTQRLRGGMLEHFAARYLVDDPLLATLRGSFAGLPDAYALALLNEASAAQRQRMQVEARVPLALAEQARAARQEARLTRTREALYLPSSYHADAVTLAFALIRRHGLPAGAVNLVLREGSSAGATLERLFPEDAAARITVMVRREGRFELFDDHGRPSELEVAQPQGLFEVLAACLPSTFLQHHGWAGEGGAGHLRASLQAWLPRDRLALMRLLGWREARQGAARLHRLADGRVGYLLSGRGSAVAFQGQTLRQRIRSLYPSFDGEQVERFLQLLLIRSGSAYACLLRQEQEYRQLDGSLGQWSDAVNGASRGHRRAVADAFRRAWRLEGEEVVYSNGEPGGLSLRIYGIPAGSLPALPAGTDYSHITDLALVGLRLETLPAGFLRGFPQLRRLNLSNNDLTAIPGDLDALRHLRHLRMARNQVRLIQPHVNVLAGLSHLSVLDLSENALGTVNLSFNQLARLRELHLYRSGLQAVPEGLEWCGLLDFVDLRHNQIGSLPQALLEAPQALRRVVHVEGNPLSEAERDRLYAAEPPPAHPQAPEAGVPAARTSWLGTLAEQERERRAGQWDALLAEPGHEPFFELLAQLIESSDFRLARDDLSRRVWAVIEVANADTGVREDLFERAADPRTCVDSVAHCFSQLEVRMRVLQATQGADPLATRDARLLLAQRMFRLDQVEAFARADFTARIAQARGVDEVEVSLAYRTGLAQRLNLLGQPRSMQFQAVAGVTAEHLEQACRAVLAAEAGSERARYISQRDFWTPFLRARYPEAFTRISDSFDSAMEALDEEKESLGSGAYTQRCDQLRRDTEGAFEALALQLTQKELEIPR
ncbi:NEL-type E3 ubiquitin ligase domain-containing protein [Pseudomonas sp. CAM1A]|uniref:NEL-type E3 ubiquitin ligase domain-containing protein n=1 Tax=Pseudomonas sp. CAM1A TaxID=3231717 RepID=UPI0039C68CF0